MAEVTFFVHGLPKGQPRPKAYSRGGKAGVYDPGTANEWKYKVGKAAQENAPAEKFKQAIVTLVFLFPRPQRLLKKSSPRDAVPHLGKPDADNLYKAVVDAITDFGCVWDDDAIVYGGVTWKFYVSLMSESLSSPGVRVRIQDEEDPPF